jgi:tRNA (guanine-N7-)-methyltransferase
MNALLTPNNWLEPLSLDAVFETPGPLEVDVGCGKGRFLVVNARRRPDTNFLGIDRQLRRIRKVERKVQRENVSNVRLLHIEASYAMRFLLPERSVRALYLFFPDPWPKRRHHRRRLCREDFPDAVDRVLEPGGVIHMATDHVSYHREMQTLFEADPRFDAAPAYVPDAEERTEFETVFRAQGLEIGRCSFRRSPVK